MHEHATPGATAGRAGPDDLEAMRAEEAPPAIPVTVSRGGGHVTVSFDVPDGWKTSGRAS